MLPRELRTTFDRVAELYDQKRPISPTAMFDDIVALSGIPNAGRVLEVGCGTGQATLPMAERGYRITAVELGANLAAIARRNLARFPDVDVQVSAFEDWPLPSEPFDLVLSVASFHWLDPDVALPKIASALRPGGAFALAAPVKRGPRARPARRSAALSCRIRSSVRRRARRRQPFTRSDPPKSESPGADEGHAGEVVQACASLTHRVPEAEKAGQSAVVASPRTGPVSRRNTVDPASPAPPPPVCLCTCAPERQTVIERVLMHDLSF